MKKDIEMPPVKGVFVAMIPQQPETGETAWNATLINTLAEDLHTVLVTSKGYAPAEKGEEPLKTSTLRHFFREIGKQSAVIVEPVMPELFALHNEYWVSYYIGTQLYDKKFTFVPDSVVASNLVTVPLLGVQGVLHS